MSLPIPMWNATQTMLAIRSTWAIAATVLSYLLSAILPVFYFSLYRNDGIPRLSKRLRLLSLAGALAGGIVVAAGLSVWLETFSHAFRPYLTTLKMLLSDFVNLACILLLIAFFRQASDEPHAAVSISRLLRFVTRAALIAGGLWFTFNLLRLALTPYVYHQLENQALQIGVRPPQTEADMTMGAIRTLLEQIFLFTAPFIVYKSALRRA
jgi:hypothetical protein